MLGSWGGDGSARLVTALACTALIGGAIFSYDLLTNPSYELGGDAFGGLYRMDAFGSFAKILIFLASAACLVIAPRYFEERGGFRGEYPVLLLFNAVGMSMMVSAVDFITLYIGLELSSLSSYVLAAIRSEEHTSELQSLMR